MEITVKHEITFSPVLETFLTSLLTPKTAVEPVQKAGIPHKEIYIGKEMIAAPPIETAEYKVEKAEEIKAEPKKSDITVEYVRSVVAAKTSKNKDTKPLLVEALSSFGADSVTKLDPAKYAEFLEKIKDIN